MKKIGIVTDSHSGILQEEAKELGIYVLPMPFYINDICFYENCNLTRNDFYEALNSDADVRTSQPSPTDLMAIWDQALTEYETIVHIPISSGLSGSCSTACALASEPPYEGKVFVVDNGRVASPMHRSVLDALELVQEGYSAFQIKTILEHSKADMVIYVAVDNLTHLKKGGRISPTTASVGTLLNVKPILKFDVGTLDSFKNCRGMIKARKAMIEAVKHDLETTFARFYEKGEAYVVAASSSSPEITQAWLTEIRAAFPGMDILCDDLAMGISCHIGPGGLGIGVSCRPDRSVVSRQKEQGAFPQAVLTA